MRRQLTSLLLACAALACIATAARRADATDAEKPEYNSVVRLVETHYHVKHRGIPFLANAGVKTAKVFSSTVRKYSRFADLKLAVFEDQDFTRGDHAAFHASVRRMMEPMWTPLVVVRGQDAGQTYTYTREDKDRFKVLIIALGDRDGTVLEVGLNEEEFFKLLMNPEQETKEISDAATSQDGNDKDK